MPRVISKINLHEAGVTNNLDDSVNLIDTS
jgi:hypothetical protein